MAFDGTLLRLRVEWGDQTVFRRRIELFVRPIDKPMNGAMWTTLSSTDRCVGGCPFKPPTWILLSREPHSQIAARNILLAQMYNYGNMKTGGTAELSPHFDTVGLHTCLGSCPLTIVFCDVHDPPWYLCLHSSRGPSEYIVRILMYRVAA